MKYSRIILALAVLLPFALGAGPRKAVQPEEGTFLEQVQPRDSILIADQVRYGVRLLGVREGTRIGLPDYSKGKIADQRVAVLTPWIADTLKVYGKGEEQVTMDIEYYVLATSFEEGFCELPPIAVARELPDGTCDTLVYKPLSMDVRTMPVDTTTFIPHDIKDQVRYPLTPGEILPYFALFYLLAMLVTAAACLFIMRRRRTEGGDIRREPAHIVALRKLDKFRGDKLWADDKQKGFYSGVTDTLREYIASRYGFGAMEMTTREIFNELKGNEMEPELYEQLKELFERSDFVKFAKYVASREENSQAVPLAVRFVTSTYQQQLDQEEAAEGQQEKKD